MNAPVVLWNAWREQVKDLFSWLHGHQKKTLALVVLGIILSGSAVREPHGRELVLGRHQFGQNDQVLSDDWRASSPTSACR